ncbi:hypothetical protein MTQ10_14450 [Streptomyces sp. XM83C]|jgi:hypothetical protein|uniref:Uncharacterized protein n=1 Tax=Streptomyces thermocoprophilus TaxID=78356 RepID=A0ABV5V7J9_9ACTN|nr:hypothetical protein [Streptomyces sp. XM83C]MCK1820781.1 hypothetical protein [Streptomyces sp. XM83C]
MRFDDTEPVFERKPWGRHTYNPRNPIGFGLIVTHLVVGGVLLLMLLFGVGPFG